jgi:hypothetical protein
MGRAYIREDAGMRLGLVLAVAALLVVGCGVGGSSDDIGDAVHEAATSGRPFRLADATDFDWDRFYAVPPYSSPKAIEEQLGFEWGDAVHSGIKTNDVITLLVFVRDGEVVKAFDQGNGDGYFHCVGKRGLTPEEAIFRVKRVDEGDFYLDYVLGPPPRPAACPR